MISTSKTRASCGRVCLLFAAATAALTWSGPRPCDVLDASQTPDTEAAPGVQLIEANVKVSGIRDTALLAKLRARPEGNTFGSVPLFDALTPEQRAEVAEQYSVWAEWMPYQVGQAAKVDDQASKFGVQLTGLREDLNSAHGRMDTISSFISSAESSISSVRSDVSSIAGRVGPLETKVGTLETNVGILDRVQKNLAESAQSAHDKINGIGGTATIVGSGDPLARAACKTLANHLGNDGSSIIGVIHGMIDNPPAEGVVPVHGTTCCTPHREPEPEPEPTTETKAETDAA